MTLLGPGSCSRGRVVSTERGTGQGIIRQAGDSEDEVRRGIGEAALAMGECAFVEREWLRGRSGGGRGGGRGRGRRGSRGGFGVELLEDEVDGGDGRGESGEGGEACGGDGRGEAGGEVGLGDGRGSGHDWYQYGVRIPICQGDCEESEKGVMGAREQGSKGARERG